MQPPIKIHVTQAMFRPEAKVTSFWNSENGPTSAVAQEFEGPLSWQNHACHLFGHNIDKLEVHEVSIQSTLATNI